MVSALRELRLSEDLCAAAEKKFGEKFENVEHLLEFVLEELLRGEASQLDLAEQRMIEDRLRALGYI